MTGFANRAASTNWETVTIPGLPGVTCWAWFRPDSLPTGIAISMPPELLAQPIPALPFSLAQLLEGVGLSWNEFGSLSLYGTPWQPAAAWQAAANQPFPAPQPGGSNQILLGVIEPHSAPAPMPMTTAPQSASPLGDGLRHDTDSQALFQRVETDWKACQGLERQLSGLRSQLSSTLGRLGHLDRDLHPQEALGADRQDKDEWQDARRFIRDGVSKVHRCIKAHDIGITSAAGRRTYIQRIYEQAAESSGAGGDLANCLREVESYRKELANLMNSMNGALTAANANGIQRAQRILSRIATRMRSKRAKDRGRS
jgi:hypothetical protein